MAQPHLLRVALWTAVPVNLLGVGLFLAAATGTVSPLIPVMPPPLYATEMALTIGLFAAACAWMAMQRDINRPLLMMTMLGKLGFFSLLLVHATAGDFAMKKAAGALPDLILGLIFAWHLRGFKVPISTPKYTPPGTANRFIVRPLDRPHRSRERGRRSEDLD